MAGNLPLLNGVEVKVVWTYNAQPYALNVLHFNNPQGAAMTQSLCNAIDASIKGAFASSLLPAQIHTGVSLVRIESRSMTAPSDPWFLGSGAPQPGTAVGKPLPAATSLVVTNRTGLRGRSFNGRTYIFGWAELANDAAGGATAAATTAAALWLNAVRTSMAGATPSLVLGILSRFTTPPGAPPGTPATERPTPLLTAVTTSLCLDARWDTQRRRAIPGI